MKENGIALTGDENFMTIIKIENLTVEFSVVIDSIFTVKAQRRHLKVDVRNLLGFHFKLERYSQLSAVIDRLKNTEISASTELKHHVQELQNICKPENCEIENVPFLLRQLELSLINPRGRRYSVNDIMTASRFFFSSQNCYRAMREKIPFPQEKVIKNLFGGLGETGTDHDCQIVVHNNFSNLSGEL